MEMNQDNYENYLLLYIDNELTASEKAAVELLLASNPKQAQELKALQAVQLKPEYIEYSEKSSLYRFEEMNASLDPAFKKSLYKNSSSSAKLIDIKKFYWATGSIAAMAIGIFFGVKTFTPQPASELEKIAVSMTSPATAVSIQNEKNITTSKSNNTNIHTKEISAQSNNEFVNQVLNIAAIVPENDPINSTANTTVIDSKETTVEATIPVNIVQTNNSSLAFEQKIEKESFEEINTEDNDRSIYISNIEFDGDKFRGITRRLGVLFKRNKSEKNK